MRPRRSSIPSTGLCRYNGRTEQEIQPETERLNLFARGTLQIRPTLQAYLELGYFQTKTKSNGTWAATTTPACSTPPTGQPGRPRPA